MINPENNPIADLAAALLIHYSFDLGGYTTSAIINRWINNYPNNWVRLAVIESLYRGRYKAVSVDQILAVWQRRGQALYHFNREFERLICDNIPQQLKHDTSVNLPLVAKEQKLEDAASNGFIHSLAQAPLAQNSQNGAKKSLDLPNSATHQGITQFTPDKTATSELHTKLKTISQSDRHTIIDSKHYHQNSED